MYICKHKKSYISVNINIYIYIVNNINIDHKNFRQLLSIWVSFLFPPEFVQIPAVKLHEVQALKQYQSKRPRSAKALAPKFLDPLRLVIPSTLETGGFFLIFFWGSTDQPIQLQQLINWIKFLKDEGPELEIFALVHDKSGWEKEVMAITKKVMKPLEGYIEKKTATWKWLAFLNNCQCSEVQFKLSSDPLVPK